MYGNGRHLSGEIREYYTVRYKPVQKLFEAENIKWYDTLDAFIAFIKQDKRMDTPDPSFWIAINPANGHPGAQATHVHAYETANILETYYPATLGKKSLPIETAKFAQINDWVPLSIDLRQNKEHIFFVYPNNDVELLAMPIRKPFVQLNLATPMPVCQIKLNGINLKAANVYFSADDVERHFDDGTLTELGRKQGNFLTWQVPMTPQSSHVNTIRVCAEFKGADHKLLMDIIPNK